MSLGAIWPSGIHERANRRLKKETERLYNYLVAFVGDNGYPPRRRDISDDLGFSVYQLDLALVRRRGAGRICEGSTLPTVYLREPLPPVA